MADWQEWANACFISLIFAYMLAKLISVVVSFREENLRVERERDTSPSAPLARQPSTSGLEKHNSAPAEQRNTFWNVEASETPVTLSERNLEPGGIDSGEELGVSREIPGGPEEFEREDKITATSHGKTVKKDGIQSENLLSDNEDWEGIDTTELDETFGLAAAFVEKAALDPSIKVSSDLQLQFYGLYKQATEGPCSIPQPPAYKLTARAKWHAWKKLGDISPEEGMRQYITLLSDLFPDWNKNFNDKNAGSSQEKTKRSSGNTGRIGPVFSMLAKQESSEEDGLGKIHIFAKGGDRKGIENLLENNTPIDQTDCEGRTALHWAVDQGHMDIVKLLVLRGAQINAKDSEGQTALHYAETCQWPDIAVFLLENGADPSITDNNGSTPYEHPPSNCQVGSTCQS